MGLFAAKEQPQPLQPHGIVRWSLAARIFHWISVLLLIATWAMVQLNDDAITDTYLDLHKAFGLSVLFWTLGRMISRLIGQNPKDVYMPKWQSWISRLTHLALYLLLLAMPISAWFATMMRGDGVSMFGLFEIPAFLGQNGELARNLMHWHKDIFWPALLTFTGLHIVGALYHQFIMKDHLIKRMR